MLHASENVAYFARSKNVKTRSLSIEFRESF